MNTANLEFNRSAIDPTGCISNGWNLIKPIYGTYFIISILGWVLISCIPCISLLLYGPIMSGIYYVLLRDMRGEPVEFSMMFKGFEKFGATLAVGVLQMLPWIIWQIFDFFYNVSTTVIELNSGRSGAEAETFILGGMAIVYIILTVIYIIFSIVWGISFVFALPLVVEKDMAPIDAIKLSIKAAWSNVGGIIVLAIFNFFMMVGGFLILCIGLFFILPLVYASWAFAYRQVFPASESPFRQTGPPMPGEYGLSYGRGN